MYHPKSAIHFLPAFLAISFHSSSGTVIPFSQIGSEATKLSGGKGCGITGLWNGYRLDCRMQALEAMVTVNGAVITSTSQSEGTGDFSITPVGMGRDGTLQTLPRTFDWITGDDRLIRCGRRDILEEYATTGDGIRQDFVINHKPEGNGNLMLEVAIDGTELLFVNNKSASDGSVGIRLAGGRTLVYHSLKVYDVTGKKLPATFREFGNNRIAVEVDDREARYPVRIDPTITDAHWVGIGQAEGLNRKTQSVQTNVLATDNKGNLYVGGMFDFAGGLPANNIAKWNGSEWSALENGLHSLNAVVDAIVFDTLGNMYAGGRFDSAGAVPAKNIAKWDGNHWSALGSGVNDWVLTLATDHSNMLYAGGSFITAGPDTVNHIARWDGTAWHALEKGISGTGVMAGVIDKNGDLVVGGSFTAAGTAAVKNVAKWDGSGWSALGEGITGANYPRVNVLLTDASGTVYAGGQFTTAGSVTTRGIAKWDGTAWSGLGDGINGSLRGLVADQSQTLFAIADIDTSMGTSTRHIVIWDGAAWTTLPRNNYEFITALAIDPQGTLFASGQTINRWNDNHWLPLLPKTGKGFNGKVTAIAVDSMGATYVGGEFTMAGALSMRHLAKWDGSAWKDVGRGTNKPVSALVVDRHGTLYVGGYFDTVSNMYARGIAKWDADGDTWNPVGSGVYGASVTIWGYLGTIDPTGPVPIGTDTVGRVFALAVDDSNHLFAGGIFDTAGGVPAHNIAKWDGGGWTALGNGIRSSGVTHQDFRVVYAIAATGGGSIYAGGFFDTAGSTTVHNIARWNGTGWSDLSGGFNGTVTALAAYGTEALYAAGFFDTAGIQHINNIARWNGTAWNTLGSGTKGGIYALATTPDGNLFAGGIFDSAGSQPANNIAQWNGTAWTALGSGTNDIVYALCREGSTTLCAGGSFTTAGDKVSARFARCSLDAAPVRTAVTINRTATPIVYNPAAKQFLFSLDRRCTVNFRIYTLSGREVYRATENMAAGRHTYRIAKAALSRGTYIGQVSTGSSSLRCKMAVNR